MSSSASGLISPNPVSCAVVNASSLGDSSSKTSAWDCCPFFVRLRRLPQKNLSSHSPRWSASNMNGRSRVRIRMQLSASRSGASSTFGKEGLCRKAYKREVTARMRVSRFRKESSRIRRMSVGEKSEKTSSDDSGSSQNCGCQSDMQLERT